MEASWVGRCHKYLMHGATLVTIHKTPPQHVRSFFRIEWSRFRCCLEVLLWCWDHQRECLCFDLSVFGWEFGISSYGMLLFLSHECIDHRRIEMVSKTKKMAFWKDDFSELHQAHLATNEERRMAVSFAICSNQKEYFKEKDLWAHIQLKDLEQLSRDQST